MARPLVFSNGELHVGLNTFGLVHDFYYPYVGLENHSAGDKLRHKVGVYVEGAISWLDDDPAWTFNFKYAHTALVGHTRAINEQLGIILEFEDCVDAENSVFIRNIHIVNTHDRKREIKLYMHQAFAIGDSRSNTDTAQYLPDSDAILHYRGRRAFVISGNHGEKAFDQHTIGLFGIENHEGSYRDAEDGQLSGNTVEHGRVDSIVGFTLEIDAHSSDRVNYWISAGMSMREALSTHKSIQDDGIYTRLHSTIKWWHEWLEPAFARIDDMPRAHRIQFLNSLMVMKSHMDKRGAVIASTDSSMLNYSRDAYAYSWPRDGAYALWPLVRLGYKEEPYRFFEFCKRGLHPSGYLSHKYLADGSIGSSWHPYQHGDITAPPIQEDETAGVLFVFYQFYQMQKDASLIKEFYSSMVVPMANFLAEYVDEGTHLPKPSYDLWEEHFLTTTYSTSVTYGGLIAAAELAAVAGDQNNAVKWRTAAEDIRAAAHKYLYDRERGAFHKGVTVDHGVIYPDTTLDLSAFYGVFMYGLFDMDGLEIRSTVRAVQKTFNNSADQPGLPRYEHDVYRRTSDSVMGNYWPITSLWYAQYSIEQGDIDYAWKTLDWVQRHTLQSGMIGEQIDPTTDQLVSPAPLTWSHAEYVSTLLDITEDEDE
jgi:GH15 family glucan-1,4-alpha-glucosidase